MLKPGPNPTLAFYFALITAFCALPALTFAQGCLGANGSGVITGGATSLIAPGYSGGYLCANLDFLQGTVNDPAAGAVIEINAGNVKDGENVVFVVNWDDGTGDQFIPIKTGANTWKITVNDDSRLRHFYPTQAPGVKCDYTPSVSLFIENNLCTTTFGSIPPFTRWNIDSENSGNLVLTTTSSKQNIYKVCAGTQVKLNFRDRSEYNCTGASPPNNTATRWRQFVYGSNSTDPNFMAGVKVAGAVRAYPYSDAGSFADNSSDPASIIKPTDTYDILVPSTAAVGDVFEIKMNYWNVCNPYPTATPTSQTAQIVVVAKPSPPIPVNTQECGNSTADGYYVTLPNGASPTSVITWYFNTTASGSDAPGTVIKSSTSNSLKFTDPGAPVPNAPGDWKVWATYHDNGVNGNGCESDPTEVTLTLLAPTVSLTPAPDQSICDDLQSNPLGADVPESGTASWSVFSKPASSTTINFTNVADANAQVTVDVPGVYVFRWTAVDGLCTVYDDVQVTFDVKPSAPVPPSFSMPTCDMTVKLTATAVDQGGTGAWSTVGTAIIADATNPVTFVDVKPGVSVITWTVTSQFLACPVQKADYTVTRYGLPAANNSVTGLCEDAFGSGKVTNFNLSGFNNDINSSAGYTITWYSDAAHASLITSATLTNTLQLFVRVQDNVSLCSTDRTVVPTVFSLPTLAPQSAAFCELTKGSQKSPTIDLDTEFGAKLTNSNPTLKVNAWYDNSSGVPTLLTPAQRLTFSYTGSANLLAEVINTNTGCTNTAGVQLTITTQPDVNPILLSNGDPAPATLRFCSGADIVVLHVDPNVNPGSTFDWQVDPSFQVLGGGSPNFYLLLQFPNAIAAPGLNIKVRELKNGNCPGSYSPVKIIVDPPAVSGPDLSGLQQVCTNQTAVSYSVQSPTPGSTYAWTVPGDAVIVGSNTGSSVSVNWGVISGSITAKEITSGGCASPLSTPYNVTVNARPSVLSLFPQVCADDPSVLSSQQDLTVYESSINASGGLTFTWKDAGNSIISNLANYPVTNANPLTVQVSDGTCDANATVLFTVNPFFAGSISGMQSVCAGSSAAILTNQTSPSGGVPGNYIYQWQSSPDDFATPLNIQDEASATDLTFDPGVVNTTLYYRRRAVVGTCKPQYSPSVKVTALTLPTGDFTTPGTLCSKDPAAQLNFTFTTNGPFLFDYHDDHGNNFTNQIGASVTPVAIPGLTQNTTYTLTRVEDVNHCVANLNTIHAVNVIQVTTDFAVNGADTQCSGATFKFDWTVDPNVTYTWVWGDGNSDVVTPNTLANGTNTFEHIFANASPASVASYAIELTAKYDDGTTVCEAKKFTDNVDVYPKVQPAIGVKKDVCQGETLVFNNQSIGATTSEWYIGNALIGTTTGNDAFQYAFTSAPINNPDVVIVTYKGINNFCPGSLDIPLNVYKKVDAAFTFVLTKPFSDYATITYTNTSSLTLQDPAIQYDWIFGDANDATPGSYSGPIKVTGVNYASSGTKYVTLSATNVGFAGCSTSTSKMVVILKPTLSGNFTVTPLAACVPTTLTVQNNIVGGDSFEWSLVEETRGLVATATGFEPELNVASGGNYKLHVIVTQDGSGAAYDSKMIQIFNLPQVSFLPNPTVVNIPDVAVTFVNQSKGATSYQWDFGDNTTSTDEQPVHAYVKADDYIITLTAINNHGSFDVLDDGTLTEVSCTNSTTQNVKAIEGGSSLVPNAFTPSKNGPNSASSDARENDYFLPITKGVESFEMEIYDRWGVLIFISKDKTQGWDGYDKHGNLLPAGVYVFKLSMTLSNGQHTTQMGDVTLLR